MLWPRSFILLRRRVHATPDRRGQVHNRKAETSFFRSLLSEYRLQWPQDETLLRGGLRMSGRKCRTHWGRETVLSERTLEFGRLLDVLPRGTSTVPCPNDRGIVASPACFSRCIAARGWRFGTIRSHSLNMSFSTSQWPRRSTLDLRGYQTTNITGATCLRDRHWERWRPFWRWAVRDRIPPETPVTYSSFTEDRLRLRTPSPTTSRGGFAY